MTEDGLWVYVHDCAECGRPGLWNRERGAVAHRGVGPCWVRLPGMPTPRVA